MALLINDKKFLIILLGGSGSGKTSLENMLINTKPLDAANLVSICTRVMRDEEIEGQQYYFKTRDQIDEDDLANLIEIDNEWIYGVPKTEFKKDNKILIYSVINLQPALEIIDYCKYNTEREIIVVYYDIKKEDRAIKLLERGEKFDKIALRFNREDDPEWVKGHLKINLLVDEYKNLYDIFDNLVAIIKNLGGKNNE